MVSMLYKMKISVYFEIRGKKTDITIEPCRFLKLLEESTTNQNITIFGN
jgi:hypothetical protein